MPIVAPQKIKVPFWQFNGHLQTIVPSMNRKIPSIDYRRERINTSDDDFLDLDWVQNDNKRIVIVSHGLEGGADRHYCKGIAKLFSQNQWDVLAWNCRSCSGELNKLPRFYHHNDVKDMSLILDTVRAKGYAEISLVGFSMGGAISINVLGDQSTNTDDVIGCVAVSTPIDLKTCSDELEKKTKGFYNQKFFKKLKAKVIAKAQIMEGIDATPLLENKIVSLRGFDQYYTAPLHGFESAEEFYYQASPERRIKEVKKPFLVLNALNDPFLTKESYPFKLAEKSKYLYLETPKKGGHVGFCMKDSDWTYAELRSLEFLNNFSKYQK